MKKQYTHRKESTEFSLEIDIAAFKELAMADDKVFEGLVDLAENDGINRKGDRWKRVADEKISGTDWLANLCVEIATESVRLTKDAKAKAAQFAPRLQNATPEKLVEVGKAWKFSGPASKDEKELARQFSQVEAAEAADKARQAEKELNAILS